MVTAAATQLSDGAFHLSPNVQGKESPKPRKISAISDLTDGVSTVSSLNTSELPSFMDNHVFSKLKQRLG